MILWTSFLIEMKLKLYSSSYAFCKDWTRTFAFSSTPHSLSESTSLLIACTNSSTPIPPLRGDQDHQIRCTKWIHEVLFFLVFKSYFLGIWTQPLMPRCQIKISLSLVESYSTGKRDIKRRKGKKKNLTKLIIVTHTYNTRTKEVEAGGRVEPAWTTYTLRLCPGKAKLN